MTVPQPQPDSGKDAALKAVITTRLSQSGISRFDRLSIEIEHGVVTVTGCVPTYYQRQLIVHAIYQIPDVRRVVDTVEVVGEFRT